MRLKIKVVPGAKKSEVIGWYGEQLKVRVSPPPEKGKANKAVLELLATALNVSPSSIEIISGHNSSNKTVEIVNLNQEEILIRLSSVER